MTTSSFPRANLPLPGADGARSYPWPELALAKATVATSSRWRVAGPREQAVVVAATHDAWSRRALPDGLLSYSVFVGDDGRTLLHHAMWADDAAYDTYTAFTRPSFQNAIARAPGAGEIERLAARKVRRHRSVDLRGRGTSRAEPACLVAADIRFDGARAREWTDALVTAIRDGGGLPDGALGVHLHVGEDGRSVLKLGEWTHADAHRTALDTHGGRLGDSQAWERVRAFPGVTFSYARYRLGFAMRPSTPTSPTWWRWA